MKNQKKNPEKPESKSSTKQIEETTRQLAAGLGAIYTKISVEGFVPKADLTQEFGPTLMSRGLAILWRDWKALREVRKPWGDDGKDVVGYEITNRAYTKHDLAKMPPWLLPFLNAPKASVGKYTDYQRVALRCRFTMPSLGGLPSTDAGGSALLQFVRDADGVPIIPRYCLRALAAIALPRVGLSESMARRIAFQAIKYTGPLKIIVLPVISPTREGGKAQGCGLKNVEAIPAGTEFVIVALIPTSNLSIARYIEMIEEAGRSVGLSHGRSAGFGDFEVLGQESG